MALRNEKRYILWNGEGNSEDAFKKARERIDSILEAIPQEYQDSFMQVENILMDLGAYHYREQVRMMVNGEAFAFLLEEK